MDTPTIIGSIGSAIILILFILNQLNKLKNDNFYYDLFNLVGSLMLMYYAIALNSLPFVILDLVWALFSLKDVILKLLKMKKIKLTL